MRQSKSEKPCCSAKDVEQQWQKKMENLFSTFSADELTDSWVTVTFRCSLRTSGNVNDERLANGFMTHNAVLFVSRLIQKCVFGKNSYTY